MKKLLKRGRYKHEDEGETKPAVAEVVYAQQTSDGKKKAGTGSSEGVGMSEDGLYKDGKHFDQYNHINYYDATT